MASTNLRIGTLRNETERNAAIESKCENMAVSPTNSVDIQPHELRIPNLQMVQQSLVNNTLDRSGIDTCVKAFDDLSISQVFDYFKPNLSNERFLVDLSVRIVVRPLGQLCRYLARKDSLSSVHSISPWQR